MILLVKLFLTRYTAGIHRAWMQNHDILLVDRQPVLNLILEFLKQQGRIRFEGIDRLPIGPAAVFVKRQR